MRRLFLSMLTCLSLVSSAFAAELPFTDVQKTDSYYEGVLDLYRYGIISDDGSHEFRPDDPIERDMFVGLATSVSCHKCITPSLTDIITYKISPFIDLEKTNTYYYCIAYAADTDIVRWYTLDTSGSAKCQNNSTYSSIPFCPENKTTRIEAAAMLLRQANLWDDTRNTWYIKKTQINDVDAYWQGYAEKWIEAGILTLSSDNTIEPNESISRWEFAMMAGKMLAFNQCSVWTWWDNTMASAIGSIDKNGTPTKTSRFYEGDGSALVPITSTGTWNYTWTMTNPDNWQKLTATWDTLPTSLMGSGTWIVELDVIDPKTGEIVSEPSSTIIIDGPDRTTWADNTSDLSVIIRANPIITDRWTPVIFTPYISGSVSGWTYTWDFGDGTTSSSWWVVDHTYENPGIYTVTLTITNDSGETSQAQIIIEVTGRIDTDKDWVYDDEDDCIFVKWPPENDGCPVFDIGDHGDTIGKLIDGRNADNGKDTDFDGISDRDDLCILVAGTGAYDGCPSLSILSGITENQCFADQLQSHGLIIATPVCNICPCDNTISLNSLARKCDILFPAILSKDKSSIYSRGGFYQIQ